MMHKIYVHEVNKSIRLSFGSAYFGSLVEYKIDIKKVNNLQKNETK